jgi:hypothetical protein
MKRIIFFILLVGQLSYAQLYFSEPTSTHIDYIYENGQGPIAYHMFMANGYYVYWWRARLEDPSPIQTDWMEGQSGGWWVNKAGTYKIHGQTYARYYWSGEEGYHNKTVTWSVVDNYAPAVPQNFDVTVYLTGYNAHPKLTWTLNTEYDGEAYYIERRVTGEQNFSFLTTVNWITNQYIDYTINYAGGGQVIAEYKMRAHDINGHYSNYTSIESVHYGEAWKIGTGQDGAITEYKLEQCYPNPFNPITTINYQIKENGFVSLKVYDLVGKEVANLIDEVKSPGLYSVSFDGSNLPSGIYICSLRVNEFVQNMKMTLLK